MDGRPGHHHQAVHTVTDDSDDDFASRLECLEFSSIEKNSGDNCDELYASLDIQYKCPASLKVKVNTGAQGNILLLHIFRKKFPPKTGSQQISSRGNYEEKTNHTAGIQWHHNKTAWCRHPHCKHKDTEWHSSGFFVTESLQLVTIHCMVQTAIHNAMDLKRLDRFKGIRDFKGELHITLQEDAQPVVQPPRKYPIQLLKEIRAELEKMEDLGVITFITEPTDWVNALAFSRKASGGLRVCLDPRSQNQCIKRTHHKTPTLEITNHLSSSKVFSKLDVKLLSIKLDEE